MTTDERDLRREFTRAAQQVDIPPGLADRIIVNARTGRAAPHSTGQLLRRWSTPLLAASVAALLIAAVAVGQYLMHSTQADHPTAPATQSNVVGPVSSSPVPHSSPTPSSSASKSGGAAALPLPAGFTARDLTFVSNDDGWALGTAGCDELVVGCRSVIAHTTDGGRSWSSLPEPAWSRTGTDVIHLRFADDRVGYAYSPEAMYATVDGGMTWRHEAGGVWGLEVADGVAVRVLGQEGCAPGCSFRVERAPVGSSNWQAVALPPGQYNVGAQLVRTGRLIAVATYGNPAGGSNNAHGALSVSNDDGATWTARSVCPSQLGPSEIDINSVSIGPDGTILVVCQARMAGGPASLQLSADGGASFRSLPSSLGSAPVTLAGVASPQVLFVQSDALYRSNDGGASWHRVQSQGSGPLSASFIGFETSSNGRVLDVGQNGSRTVWTTADAGQSWARYNFG